MGGTGDGLFDAGGCAWDEVTWMRDWWGMGEDKLGLRAAAKEGGWGWDVEESGTDAGAWGRLLREIISSSSTWAGEAGTMMLNSVPFRSRCVEEGPWYYDGCRRRRIEESGEQARSTHDR